MKMTERLEHLCEEFNITAHDWHEFYNEFEKLPPAKRHELIHAELGARNHEQQEVIPVINYQRAANA